jgi:hypothetical protein
LLDGNEIHFETDAEVRAKRIAQAAREGFVEKGDDTDVFVTELAGTAKIAVLDTLA